LTKYVKNFSIGAWEWFGRPQDLLLNGSVVTFTDTSRVFNCVRHGIWDVCFERLECSNEANTVQTHEHRIME